MWKSEENEMISVFETSVSVVFSKILFFPFFKFQKIQWNDEDIPSGDFERKWTQNFRRFFYFWTFWRKYSVDFEGRFNEYFQIQQKNIFFFDAVTLCKTSGKSIIISDFERFLNSRNNCGRIEDIFSRKKSSVNVICEGTAIR